MIVPDINLILYAHIAAFPRHDVARAWWEELMNGTEEVGICAPVIFGFVRIATNRRVLNPPLSADDALKLIEAWLSRAHVRFLLPAPRHLSTAFRLVRAVGTAADLTTDAQIAALAIEYQAEVHSNDSDFGRFAGLRWSNPLAP